MLLCLAVAVPAAAQDASPLNGVWTLDKAASAIPKEIGFTPSWLVDAERGDPDAAPAGGGGGRGRRGSGGGGGSRGGSGAFSRPTENYDDAHRVQLLTGEVRTPPSRLMIVDTPAAVTITNELGQSRTLHPTGKAEAIELQGVSTIVTTTRERDGLVVLYQAEPDREIRYAYSRSPGAPQLVVDVELSDHGKAGDKAHFVYGAGTATPTGSPAGQTSAPSQAGSRPAAGHTAESFDERPGAELQGIRTLGILVEDLGSEARACGLNRDSLEDALSKRLSASGFDVRKNSDEDTYVYVNVITNTMPNGACVSRYDAFLYTHATANLSYRDRPVLVQVSLMHRGGIGASVPAAHAQAVTRGLEGYLDLFATQIHDANK